MQPQRQQARRRRRRRPQRVGQIIWSPALVKSYVRDTEAMMSAVDRDYHGARGAGKVDDAVWKNWAAFLAGWRAFAAESSTWTGGTVDHAESYRERLKAWRNRLRGMGYAPDSSPIPASKPSALAAFSKDFAIALGIAGGTALILYMIKGAVRK